MGTGALLQERGKTHGDFKDHARITSKFKDVILEECRDRNLRGQRPLSLEQREALDMIAHKIGRIIAGNADFQDHWDDIAGYAKLVSDRCVAPLNPRIEEHQTWMETESKFAHACPDLDQEFPECSAECKARFSDGAAHLIGCPRFLALCKKFNVARGRSLANHPGRRVDVV